MYIMDIKIENSGKKETHLLCVFVLENSNKVLGLGKLSTKTTSAINQSLKDIEGKLGKTKYNSNDRRKNRFKGFY